VCPILLPGFGLARERSCGLARAEFDERCIFVGQSRLKAINTRVCIPCVAPKHYAGVLSDLLSCYCVGAVL
jgi:hypothetical protein